MSAKKKTTRLAAKDVTQCSSSAIAERAPLKGRACGPRRGEGGEGGVFRKRRDRSGGRKSSPDRKSVRDRRFANCDKRRKVSARRKRSFSSLGGGAPTKKKGSRQGGCKNDKGKGLGRGGGEFALQNSLEGVTNDEEKVPKSGELRAFSYGLRKHKRRVDWKREKPRRRDAEFDVEEEETFMEKPASATKEI